MVKKLLEYASNWILTQLNQNRKKHNQIYTKSKKKSIDLEKKNNQNKKNEKTPNSKTYAFRKNIYIYTNKLSKDKNYGI